MIIKVCTEWCWNKIQICNANTKGEWQLRRETAFRSLLPSRGPDLSFSVASICLLSCLSWVLWGGSARWFVCYMKIVINCTVASCYCLSLRWFENSMPWFLTLCLYKTFDSPTFESSGHLSCSKEAARLGCSDPNPELNFCSSWIIRISADLWA